MSIELFDADCTIPIGELMMGKTTLGAVVKNSILASSESGGKGVNTAPDDVEPDNVAYRVA